MNGVMEPFYQTKLVIDNKQFLAEHTTKFGMSREEARKHLSMLHKDEVWVNDTHQVNIDKDIKHGFGESLEFWHLSIKRLDKEPDIDWRDLQEIKTQLCGPNAEGFEVYPAESRLVDGANQRHLWVCVTEGCRLPIGFFDGRQVSDANPLEGGKQRPLPEHWKEDRYEQKAG